MELKDVFQSEKQMYSVLDNLHEGLYLVDLSRRITYWNKAAENITGYQSSEVVGSSCADNILVHVDCEGTSYCQGICPLAQSINDKKCRDSCLYLHHKDGHRVPVSVTTTPLYNQNNDVVGGIELFSDLSSQEANTLRITELEKMAMNDELTSLANRIYMEKELVKHLQDFNDIGIPFGVLFIDVDNFKFINDTFGHLTGDKTLKLIARNILLNSRPFDIFSRWGGDEFLGLVRNVNSQSLKKIAGRIVKLVSKSFIINDFKKVSATISVGVTIVREGDTIDSILERSDSLLYRSKRQGRNNFVYED